jgi:hypothetical protein
VVLENLISQFLYSKAKPTLRQPATALPRNQTRD